MPQHAHTRPASPVLRAAPAPTRSGLSGPQALLALQRQVGNDAVGRLVSRAPAEVDPGFAAELAADPEFAALVQAILPMLDEETAAPLPPPAVTPELVPTPSPTPPPSVIEQSVIAPSETAPSASAPSVTEQPVDEDPTQAMPGAWQQAWSRDGDKWKERGAAAASMAFGLGAGAAYTPLKAVPLGGTATIVNASTAFGDFMSEQQKPVPPLTKPAPDPEAAQAPKVDNRNMPKYVGSGTILAGALTNGIGFLANNNIPARQAGLAIQGAGQLIKAPGEALSFNKAPQMFTREGLQLADWPKAVGAVGAGTGAFVQAAGLSKQQQLRAQGLSGPAAVPPELVAAAALNGLAPAGEAANEIRKGWDTGRLNPGKLSSGMVGTAAAGVTAKGIQSTDPGWLTAGLALTFLSMALKAWGEGTKLENTSWGDLSRLPLGIGPYFKKIQEKKDQPAEAPAGLPPAESHELRDRRAGA
ncbi:hypothetical protein Acy02nite_76780 [Actinoplanes cyaneus]|uniref:Uncharacterized protein n=1 Tax=Actinoplanes cyaneus TaxID=52696 RepID=A0A919IST2_9ACTN|nr:hypothetical protein [Actinoplanes cyaneus]MCW2143944.1 hypothetical protein [Actinoplanes cyaneus]GID69797.1 hypothetical protein Acy02nite_76780 [Actinoplanes cyaneus]